MSRHSAHLMNSSLFLRFKTAIAILLMVIFAPLGNALLSKGMKDLKGMGIEPSSNPAVLERFVALAMRSQFVWLGIGSLLLFFIAYSLVLSWADYSYVQPISAFAYGTAAMLGHFFLGEFVSRLQWTGITVICLGVFFVGRTPPRTTETL
jgi:drug/metabolite transporter (DMT)-like permease